jgi:hypothetical protein
MREFLERWWPFVTKRRLAEAEADAAVAWETSDLLVGRISELAAQLDRAIKAGEEAVRQADVLTAERDTARVNAAELDRELRALRRSSRVMLDSYKRLKSRLSVLST